MPVVQIPMSLGPGVSLTSGSGSPEGSVVGGVGSLHVQADGINAEVLWRKASGIGATGWVSYGTFSGVLNALAGIALTGTLTIGGDVNLYRNAANVLKTDDSLVTVGGITSGGYATTGSIDAGDGYRQTLDGWWQDNVAASQAAVQLTRFGAGNAFPTKFIAPRAGSVTGLFVKSNEARTNGTLTIEVYINGVVTTLFVTLDGTSTTYKAATATKDSFTFAAGQEIDLRITTSGTWTPITADIRAGIDLET